MFSGGFVVTVMQDGKQVEESKQGVVAIPFGSEYVIRLRNRSDRDAVAQIFIDGENVSDGGFIVRAGQFTDIERPISEPSKFRFVSSKSSAAANAGKDDQPDDRNGVIEVKWRSEKPREREVYVIPPFNLFRRSKGFGGGEEKTAGGIKLPDYVPYNSNHVDDGGQSWCASAGGNVGSAGLNCCNMDSESGGSSRGMKSLAAPKLEEGCTVEGSRSDQSFRYAHVGELELDAVTIRLVLKGYKESAIISRGRFCGTCGKTAEAAHKFCTNCGKRL